MVRKTGRRALLLIELRHETGAPGTRGHCPGFDLAAYEGQEGRVTCPCQEVMIVAEGGKMRLVFAEDPGVGPVVGISARSFKPFRQEGRS